MKTSQLLLATLKETPRDADLISHKLMLRAGMIRKLTSGIYTWLPLGLRVLRKVETVIRDEMSKIGAEEILMPSIQPRELWDETGRWESSGAELLKIRDRHDHDYCFGPTHEEVVTALAKNELRSYKQLPIIFYQIQTKFRDEIRPRFGVMRGREFLMKDAYSFHMTEKSLHDTYQQMYDAYQRIFARLGLTFRAVLADTGNIGGNHSHEFQVLAAAGEDTIVYSDGSDYAANIDMATALTLEKAAEPTQLLQKMATMGACTVAEVAALLQVEPAKILKTLIVKGTDTPYVALVLRGDHELNEVKAAKIPGIATPLTLATREEIRDVCGTEPGFLGPLNLPVPYLVDEAAAKVSDFVCGANEDGYHYTGVNWQRDLELKEVYDLRKVVAGDLAPDGKGKLHFAKGIEVGQVFELGRKYTHAMKMSILDENGKAIEPFMGCYGIGVSRTVAAAIEQHHDERGIIWPIEMAPFKIALIPVSYHKSYRVREVVEELYAKLTTRGYEVLMDDRRERAGVMFADMDLIGIPHRLVLNESALEQGVIEYKRRDQNEIMRMPLEQIEGWLPEQLKNEVKLEYANL